MDAGTEGKTRSTFPGGPHHPGPSHRSGHRALPPTVQELEERLGRRGLARAHDRRLRRVRVCFSCAAVLAAALGYTLGLASRTTPAELSEAVQAQHQLDADISREVNRTLLQLWKMEDFESARSRGRTR